MIHITGSLEDKFQVALSNGIQQWLADEPIEKGGDNAGPKPTEMLLSSLAGCILITLRIYTNQKGWNIDGMKVDITMDDEKKVIQKRLIYPEHLTPEQRERIALISTKCPISKILEKGILIELID